MADTSPPPDENADFTDDTQMPFGLHKGKRLGDVPLPYVRWLTTLGDIDPKLLDYSIKRSERHPVAAIARPPQTALTGLPSTVPLEEPITREPLAPPTLTPSTEAPSSLAMEEPITMQMPEPYAFSARSGPSETISPEESLVAEKEELTLAPESEEEKPKATPSRSQGFTGIIPQAPRIEKQLTLAPPPEDEEVPPQIPGIQEGPSYPGAVPRGTGGREKIKLPPVPPPKVKLAEHPMETGAGGIVGAAIGLEALLISHMGTPGGSIGEFMPGQNRGIGSRSDTSFQSLLQAFQKIGNIRTRM
jgi:hypothetical protein